MRFPGQRKEETAPDYEREWQRAPLPKDSKLRLREVLAWQVRLKGPTPSGIGIYSATKLIKALGPATWRVYSSLLTFRDQDGDTRVTTKTLAVASQLSEEGVKRSLARLREAGLVEDWGWMYLMVPCSCPDQTPHHHEVYVRRVLGQLNRRGLDIPTVTVPATTVAWLEQSKGLGGKRVGAGRPKGVLDTKPRALRQNQKSDRTPYKNLSSFSLSSEEPNGSSSLQEKPRSCGCVSLFVKEEEEKSRGHQTLPRYVTQRCEGKCKHTQPNEAEPAPVSASPQGAAPAAPATLPALVLPAKRSATTPPGPQARPSGVAAEAPNEAHMHTDPTQTEIAPHNATQASALTDLLPADDSVRSWTLEGGAAGPVQRYTAEDMRAATELLNLIVVARVPAPPKIEAEMNEDERVAMLQAAFRAAHEKVLGREYFTRRTKTSARERDTLLVASAALERHNISPTSWARFSFHVWRDDLGNPRVPAPAWVFDVKRIEKHHGWCRQATGTQHSNAPLHVPAYHELLAAWHMLRTKLGQGRPTTEVVEEVLPPARFRALLIALKTQNERAKKDVEARIMHGEWVW